MARDLIHEMSPAALKSKIGPLVASNPMALPDKAKRFLAIAHLQGFDHHPENVDRERFENFIARGHTEMNRGLRPASGYPAHFYASLFYRGPMYPGAAIVYGHGMYFAEPSETAIDPPNPNFPRISRVALRYATRDGATGIVLRCGLKPVAKTMTLDDLRAVQRDEKNRLLRAGIDDLGTFAAALGIDAYSVEEAFDYAQERTWIVVNRSALVVQAAGLQIAEKGD